VALLVVAIIAWRKNRKDLSLLLLAISAFMGLLLVFADKEQKSEPVVVDMQIVDDSADFFYLHK
jgi:hypothetical protein